MMLDLKEKLKNKEQSIIESTVCFTVNFRKGKSHYCFK